MTLLCPNCATPITLKSEIDGRMTCWRIRVRLYDNATPQEPQADSDAERPADSEGATVVTGLPGVAYELATLAMGYHGGECGGLDQETLQHRLKSLRPTLSRRGGNAVWRVPYKTPSGDEWLARVDVRREGQ